MDVAVPYAFALYDTDVCGMDRVVYGGRYGMMWMRTVRPDDWLWWLAGVPVVVWGDKGCAAIRWRTRHELYHQ